MRIFERPHFFVLSALLTATALVGAGCMSPATSDTPAPQPSAAVNAPMGGPSGANTNAAAQAPTPATPPRTATIALRNVRGGTAQYGSVTLTDLPGNSTRIDIALAGDKSKSAQPAAIYAGTCTAQQAEVQYPLNPVVNGKSSTTLAVNIGAILDKAPQALKVREDGTTPNLPFAACAELK
jgi:hypothetical protein